MTTIIDKPLARFRTTPTRGGQPRVERGGGAFGAGLIRDVSIITRGEALGHGEWVDQEAVESVAKMGSQSRKGTKARFTHPGLSADGLGTFLGRFRNFRTKDEQAIADLHFARSAHNTPDGDLAKYVMDMAEEDPEALATSIVFEPDRGEMDRFVAVHEDEDGQFTSPDDDNSNNYPHMRLARLWAADVVDEPAANPGGLFRKGHGIAVEADKLCEFALGLSTERPVLQHLSADADRLAQYAARFLESHNLELRKKQMANDKPNQEPAATGITIEQLNSFGDALLSKVDERITAALSKADPKPTEAEVERKRCSELFAVAKNAGLEGYDKVAQEAIDKGTTVEQFKASIADRLIEQNKLSKDSGEQPADADAKYKKEYAANRAAFVAMSLTEAEYIASRKIDDGSDILAAPTAA